MPERSTQIHFSKGALGPLSIGELRKFNLFLKDWLREQGPKQTATTNIVDKAVQYFDHVIDTETQVGKLT